MSALGHCRTLPSRDEWGHYYGTQKEEAAVLRAL